MCTCLRSAPQRENSLARESGSPQVICELKGANIHVADNGTIQTLLSFALKTLYGNNSSCICSFDLPKIVLFSLVVLEKVFKLVTRGC